MSNSGGKITAPVNIATDIPAVLGISSTDLGTQCKSDRVNQWSKRKPMEYNSPLELSEATMANNHYGVWASVGTDVVLSNNTMRSFPWTYKKPTTYFRATDFNGYYHKAVPPIEFTFPKKLTITGGASGNLISGINAGFDDLGQSGWNTDCLSIKDAIYSDTLNYRFTVCVLAKSSTGQVKKWYVTDKKTLKQRFDSRDYGEVDVDLNLKQAGITQGMSAQLCYFLSNNNIPNGAPSLTITGDCTSLEYTPYASIRSYTVEYTSPTAGLTATIDFDLNSYTGTTFYVTRVHYKITKDSSYVPTTFYLDIQAELASVKWIWLVENIQPVFSGNVAERTYYTSQLPPDNMFVMDYAERDEFSVVLRFNDPANSYTEILATENKDVNW